MINRELQAKNEKIIQVCFFVLKQKVVNIYVMNEFFFLFIFVKSKMPSLGSLIYNPALEETQIHIDPSKEINQHVVI